jgi:anti-sigma-K factor RskA
MIDERTQEQAALYVLGALSDAESREFINSMRSNPELSEFVARLSTTTDALAGAVPMVEPPPQLRAKVLAQFDTPQKIVSMPERKIGLIPRLFWPLAISLAVVLIVWFNREGRLQQTIREREVQIAGLNELAQSLQSATNDLQRTVAALQETNRLVNLRIAMLNSIAANAPKTVAVTLWDNQRQNGVFVGENLKVLPADRDYELWVIDENQKPVAAGVFHVDENGTVRMEFKPSRLIKTAGKFAVTEEAKGGVSSPTLKNLVLASN